MIKILLDFTGFSLSAAVLLFLAIMSHLTTAGTGVAGMVSISLMSLLLHVGVQPLRWLVIADLVPVYYITCGVSLASSVYWAINMVTVMLFPYFMQVQYTVCAERIR